MERRNTAAQFWSLVLKRGADACWLWKGKTNGAGHAQWYWRGELRMVHHIAWQLTHNVEFPSRRREVGSRGLILRHTCDVGACCNPRHLVWGTQADNMKDRDERNRTSKGFNHPKTLHADREVIGWFSK